MIFCWKCFRIDISITDQFVSSNGTVLLSNVIFLFLLIEEIQISSNISTFSTVLFQVGFEMRYSYSRPRQQKWRHYEQHGNNNSRMTSLPKDIASPTGQGRPNLAPTCIYLIRFILSSNRPLGKILEYYYSTLKSLLTAYSTIDFKVIGL